VWQSWFLQQVARAFHFLELLASFMFYLDKSDSKANENKHDDEHIKDKTHEDKSSSKPNKLHARECEPSGDD